jgi:hypothetical protein
MATMEEMQDWDPEAQNAQKNLDRFDQLWNQRQADFTSKFKDLTGFEGTRAWDKNHMLNTNFGEQNRTRLGERQFNDEELTALIDQELESGLGRSPQDKEALETALKAKQSEENIKSQLSQGVGQFKTVVQQQLDKLLADAGIQADATRADVGASMAARGLGRSTGLQKGVEDVSLAEQQKRGELRQNALRTTDAVQRVQDQTVQNIEDKRRNLRAAYSRQEQDTANQLKQQLTEENIQTDFKRQIADLELSAQDEGFFAQLLGGIAGGLGSIFGGLIGGPAGAVGGSAAGSFVKELFD